jgi:hypothetical protein
MNKAKFVKEITVTDPDTKGKVQLSVYKHPNGGMFAIDSSFIEQIFEDDETVRIPDPLDFVMFDKDSLHQTTTFIELVEE